MEENKSGNNGKVQQPQFDCFMKVFFNTKTKEVAFETNVPDTITGYGLCEFAKQGVNAHIRKAQEKLVKPAKGGILNFARRMK